MQFASLVPFNRFATFGLWIQKKSDIFPLNS